MRMTMYGTPRLHLDDATVPFAAERRFQLLAFLAASADWVTREQLIAIFWADYPGPSARRNLRGLLFDLRKLSWLSGLESRSDSVRWIVESDRADFDRCVSRREWATAVGLAGAPFLDGLEANATTAFAEWLQFERQLQLDRWRNAVERHVASLANDPEAQRDAAHAALASDPLNENIVAAAIEAAVRSGDRVSAERVFTRYREELLREVGVQPSARLLAVLNPQRTLPGLPARSATPGIDAGFIGRRTELRELCAQLRRADCRRINVLGPGGIGKSTLVHAASAEAKDDFPGGVFWVDLREIAETSQVASQFAASLNLDLDGATDPWSRIHARLDGLQALLVLDNCEHLPQLSEIADRLLDACTQVKIVQTSRARLGGTTEWTFPLTGLPVPDEDETELAAIQSFDAVRLFAARAFVATPGFELGAETHDVARLVRAVEGLPLAIELAASCVRLMPVAAIVNAVEEDIAALDAAVIGGSNQRGLQATFEHSWNLLSDGERSALARLAVFAGRFEHSAAQQVAGAALPLLAALVDKSLVRTGEDGTLSLHPVVQQLALRRLNDEAAARTRHARYFARQLGLQVRDYGAERSRLLALYLPECSAAWHWCLRSGAGELMIELAEPLMRACDQTGRWTEGREQFLQALRFLDRRPGDLMARADVNRALSLLEYRLGLFESAEKRARESLRLAMRCRSMRGVDGCLNVIGGTLRQRGRWADAGAYFDRALRLARASGRTELELRISYNIATVEMATGHPERAIDRCEALLQQAEFAGDKLGTAMALVILGNACMSTGRMDRALWAYESGLALAEAHGLVTVQPFFLQTLGSCHRQLGNKEHARRYYSRALASPREHLEPQLEIFALLGLARIDMEEAAEPTADLLRQALDTATRARSAAWIASVVAGWGEWHACRGNLQLAATLLAYAAGSAAIDTMIGREADRHFDRLPLSEQERAAARARAASMELSQAAAAAQAGAV